MIYTKAHTAVPSVPSCSSSLVRQTSCCRNSRYCTLRGRGTGQSSYRDTDIPMSLCRKSCRGVRSADGCRSSNHFRHSRQSDLLTDAELQRCRSPLPRSPQVHGYFAWKESTAPMDRRQTGCTMSCCKCGMPLVLPPSMSQPHISQSDTSP